MTSHTSGSQVTIVVVVSMVTQQKKVFAANLELGTLRTYIPVSALCRYSRFWGHFRFHATFRPVRMAQHP